MEVNLTFTNVCLSVRDLYRNEDYLLMPEVQTAFSLLYALVVSVGLLGNLLVGYCVVFRRVRFTVRSVFILSLSCSDLVIGLFSVPITAITSFTKEWIFAASLCPLIGFLQGSCIFISSFTLVAIAVDRYFLILHPHLAKLNYTYATRIVLGLWVSGYLMALPLYIYMDVHSYTSYCGVFCEERWTSPATQKIYGIIVLCIQFGGPLLVNSVCYTAIARQVRRQITRRQKSQQVMLRATEEKLARRRRRTTTMTLVMLASFFLAWLPVNVLNAIRDLGDIGEFLTEEVRPLVFTIAHLISVTSTIWNPVRLNSLRVTDNSI